jgi:hypothetical protein
MSEGGVEEYNYFIGGTTHLLDVLDTLDRTEHAVLIIEGMNAWWYHTLATRYHNSLDVKFLAQHVLRLGELEVKYETRGNLGVEYMKLVGRVDAEISRRVSGSRVPKDYRSRHMDVYIYPSTEKYLDATGKMITPGVDGYRGETLME